MGLDAGLSKATRSINTWANGIKGRFIKLGLAVAGAFATSTILGSGLEKNMKFVQSVVGATEDQFKRMNETVRHLGATTEYTARQAAEGMKFLGMAGFGAEQSIAALPGILDLATAGMMGLSEAADIATNILTQMGLEVEELGRVNDVLAKVQSTSNTNIQQAAEAFIYGGTMARQLGMEIEELAGFIGLLANRGIRASMAGSTLRQAMMKLLNPSEEAREMMHQMGISVRDASGKLRNFTDVILDMVDANMDAQHATVILGARAGQLAAIFDMGRADIEMYLDIIKRSEGTTDALAKSIRETLWGSFKALTSALEEVALAFYDSYKVPLQDAIDMTVEYVREFGNFVRLNKELISLKVKTYFDTVKGAMVGIVDYITSHTQLLEYGAIGWFLFGRKGMLVGMAAGHVLGELDKIMRQIYPDYDREATISTLKSKQQELLKLREQRSGDRGGVYKYRPPTEKGREFGPGMAGMLAADTGGAYTGKDSWGYSAKSIAEQDMEFARVSSELKLLLTQKETEKRLAAEKDVADRIKRIQDDLTNYGIGLSKREGKAYEEKFKLEEEAIEKEIKAAEKLQDEIHAINKREWEEEGELLQEALKRSEEHDAAVLQAQKDLDEKIRNLRDKAMSDWIAETGNAIKKQAEMYKNLATSMTNSMSEAFIEMIMGTKSVAASFTDMANSIIRDLLRIMIQKQITEPLANVMGPLMQAGADAIGGWFGSTAPTPVYYPHGGGTIGRSPIPKRKVPMSLFAGAPRLHGGLGPNEYPAILERGEQVFPRGGGPTVIINMNNESGTPQEAQQQGAPRWDGSKFVVDVILSKLQTSLSFRQAVRGV